MPRLPWWLRLLAAISPHEQYPLDPDPDEGEDDQAELIEILTEDATSCQAELADARRRIAELEQLLAQQCDGQARGC